MSQSDADPVVRPLVKICGLTNVADAMAAIEFGADALGFNFYPGTKRYVGAGAAREWMAELPATTVKIAVVVDPAWDEALALAAWPGITALQLHGRETPGFCRRLAEQGIRFSKAIPVTNGEALSDVSSFFTRTIVLDSAHSGQFGGTGRTFPWEIADQFVRANSNLRVILAGGLTPDNVANAVATVRPFGVDVTSGVEASPGRKDQGLLRAFIAAARGC
ncbi:MAG: N-(5'-phosphoribosyl)anthranilate isomerase [Chthoniobacterales bacterium]|nr:MAG: N-(5'-phosphoribosyl)anthranilate isomerase [Chthoniobacterales bacterium]